MNKTQGALCLATTAILLLTACGADNDDDAETAGTTAETTAEPTADAPEEDSPQDAAEDEENAVFAAAEVTDVAGNPIGAVTAADTEEGIRLSVEVDYADLQGGSGGFRAIAVHENGVCEAQSADQGGEIGDFNSAGAVLPGAGEDDPGVVEGEDDLAETPGEGDPEGQGAEDQGVEGQALGEQEQQPQDAEDLVRSERAGSLPNLMINDDGTGYLEVVSTGLSEELLMQDDGTAVVIYANPDHHGNIPERYAPAGPDAGSQATGDTGQRTACGVLEAAD